MSRVESVRVTAQPGAVHSCSAVIRSHMTPLESLRVGMTQYHTGHESGVTLLLSSHESSVMNHGHVRRQSRYRHISVTEQLVLEEEVFFFGTKNTAGVRVLAGLEVAGFDGAAAATHRQNLGEWGQEVVLDEGDRDSGGTIKHHDVAMVGVWDPTRAGVDADKGVVVCWCATSLDKVTDKVIDSHDDGGVINLGDRGHAAADVGDLLDKLLRGEAEIVVDGFWDWLRVEWWDWKDGHGGVNCVDFVAIATDKGVLL
jgi:hypothetical protein